MKSHYILAPLAVLALSACGDRATDTTAADNSAAAAAADGNLAEANAAAPAALPATAQDFVNTAGASDMYEVAAAKLAQQKATDPALKDFSAMMEKAHTQSTADLKAAAAKATPAITPAPVMSEAQEVNLVTLRNATGPAFDQQYAAQQLAAHQQALALLQGYSATGDVASLKEFAAKTAPVVQQHLDKAQTLQR